MTRNKTIVIILMLVTLLNSSCEVSLVDKSPSRIDQTQALVLRYVLKKADLPGAGWRVQGEGWGNDDGGESYGITFILDQHVFVNHIVAIHSSEEQAQQAFKEWQSKWMKLTNLQPVIPYVSLNQKDDYVSGCYQSDPTDPLITCIYLQLHNRIISFIRVNLDIGSANNLTFEEVNHILSTVDKQVNDIVIDTSAGTSSP